MNVQIKLSAFYDYGNHCGGVALFDVYTDSQLQNYQIRICKALPHKAQLVQIDSYLPCKGWNLYYNHCDKHVRDTVAYLKELAKNNQLHQVMGD